MRYTSIFRFAVLASVLMFSCTGGDRHGQGAETVKLELNNGERWEANAETTEGVNNMIALTGAFDQGLGAQEYADLKAGLEQEFNYIFKNCTMKGEAHEQLHNFLLPMKPLFKGLASESEQERQESLYRLQAHLAEYGAYFR